LKSGITTTTNYYYYVTVAKLGLGVKNCRLYYNCVTVAMLARIEGHRPENMYKYMRRIYTGIQDAEASGPRLNYFGIFGTCSRGGLVGT